MHIKTAELNDVMCLASKVVLSEINYLIILEAIKVWYVSLPQSKRTQTHHVYSNTEVAF